MQKKLKFSKGFSLKRLDLAAKGEANTSYLGGYKSAFKGSGLEFEDYRIYNSNNDDSSRIDWKASRRVGQLVVREFKEERDINIYFLVDSSLSMFTGSTRQLKAEYSAEMISTLARSVLSAGDSVSLTMFSEKVNREVRPGMGMQKFYEITNELSKISNYGGYGDIDKMLEYAYNRFEERSLVMIISDFVGGIYSDKFLKLCSKKFDLIFVMVRDPRDMTLPSGEGEVFLEDPHSGTTLLVRPKLIRKDFAREVNLEIGRLKKLVKKYGGDFLFLQTDRPYIGEIVSFFDERERRWR